MKRKLLFTLAILISMACRAVTSVSSTSTPVPLPPATVTVAPVSEPVWSDQFDWTTPNGVTESQWYFDANYSGPQNQLAWNNVFERTFTDGAGETHTIRISHFGEVSSDRTVGFILVGGFKQDGKTYLRATMWQRQEDGSVNPTPYYVRLAGNALKIGSQQFEFYGDPGAITLSFVGDCGYKVWSYQPEGKDLNSVTVIPFICSPAPAPPSVQS